MIDFKASAVPGERESELVPSGQLAPGSTRAVWNLGKNSDARVAVTHRARVSARRVEGARA